MKIRCYEKNTQELFCSGFSEMADSTTLCNASLFCIQVSYPDSSVKSDDSVLSVVLSQWYLICIVYDCFCAMRLAVSDDGKLIPGRKRQEMFRSILDGRNDMRKELPDLRTRHTGTGRAVGVLASRFSQLEGLLQAFAAKCNKVSFHKASAKSLQETVRRQNAKVTDLEDCSQRSNLVFVGVSGAPHESKRELERKVIAKLIATKMGIPCI